MTPIRLYSWPPRDDIFMSKDKWIATMTYNIEIDPENKYVESWKYFRDVLRGGKNETSRTN